MTRPLKWALEPAATEDPALYRGLESLWPCWEGQGTIYDPIRRLAGPIPNGIQWVGGANGASIDFDYTANRYINSLYAPNYGTGPFAILVRGVIDSAGSNRELISVFAETGANDAGIAWPFASAPSGVFIRDSSGASVTMSSTVAQDTPYTILIQRHAGGSCELWVDGVREATGTVAGTINLAGYPFGIGARNNRGVFGQDHAGNLSLLAFWRGRSFTAVEAVRLTRDPDVLLRPAEPAPVYTEAAGGGAVTISVPAYGFGLAAAVPAVAGGASAAVPGAVFELVARAPVIGGGTTVAVPAAGLALDAKAPAAASGAAVAVPAAGLSLAALAPGASTGVLIAVPAADLTLTAIAPSLARGAVIAVPASSLALETLAPDAAAGASVAVPLDAIALDAKAPAAATGVVVVVPVSDLALAALAPAITAGAATIVGRIEVAGRLETVIALTGRVD